MPGRLLAGLLLALVTGTAAAQDPPDLRGWEWHFLAKRLGRADGLPDAATFDRLVVDSLRDVHNRGADLYNTAKDHVGAYRMYQGGLLAVRPLLGHRPAAQKLIDDGLAAAEKEANPAQKAFKLHEAIEAVRADLKTSAKAAEVAPAPRPKDAGQKPDGGKKPAGPPQPVGAKADGTSGRVTLKGKPLAAGDVTLVSVDRRLPVVLTAAVQADGTYAFANPVPPGKYVVVVTGKGIPEKYQTTTTSGLTAEVKAGANVLDLELK
ncbi:MAG: hypothetical protein C0501_08745 [Isosphaera sp.]|nr:hypothetical protein [Isosphaera sp.]